MSMQSEINAHTEQTTRVIYWKTPGYYTPVSWNAKRKCWTWWPSIYAEKSPDGPVVAEVHFDSRQAAIRFAGKDNVR